MGRMIVLLVPLLFLSACAQHGFNAPLASIENAPATTTYTPPAPSSRLIANRKVVDGLSQVTDLKLNIDGKTAQTSLKGTVVINAVGVGKMSVPFEVAGNINPDEYMAYMTATNADQLATMGIQAGAKLTCLDTSCSQSFVDLYINYKGYIYHHQVEAHGNDIPNQDTSAADNANDKQTATPSAQEGQSGSDGKVKDHQPKSPKVEKPKKPKQKDSSVEDDDDGEVYQHDNEDGSDDGEAGAYVGEPARDIEVLFPETPTSSTKPSQPTTPKADDKKNAEPTKPQTPSTGGAKDTDDEGLVQKIIRKLDQVVTGVKVTTGRLENATNIYDYQQKNPDVGFKILHPDQKHYYGTQDMLSMLIFIGQYNKDHMKSYVNNVGDISAQNGGTLKGHVSHQLGIDADISYYFDDVKKTKGLDYAVSSSKLVNGFMEEEQWALFKTLVGQGRVGRIFVHPVLKKALCSLASRNSEENVDDPSSTAYQTLRLLDTSAPGHGNHFHLRIRCSEAQPRCRQQPDPKDSLKTGC